MTEYAIEQERASRLELVGRFTTYAPFAMVPAAIAVISMVPNGYEFVATAIMSALGIGAILVGFVVTEKSREVNERAIMRSLDANRPGSTMEWLDAMNAVDVNPTKYTN